MDLGLAGKTVIVTGGGSNIGRGIALAFAREHSRVVIADWDKPQGEKVAAECRALGAEALAVPTDVGNWDQVQAMVKRTLTEFKKIDILVNNAGWTHDRLFVEKTRAEWEREIAVNFWGPINCIRAVLDSMIEHQAGRIISVSSDAGRMGEFREAVYSGCKAGIIGLSKAIAREVGRYHITLNVVCPGLTPAKPTEMGEKSMWEDLAQVFTPEAREKAARLYPLRRLGTPQDTASAVLFLASDAASFITGQTLSVSGGYTMI